VANALWLLADSSAKDTLVRLLTAGSAEERIAAVRALGTCSPGVCIPSLEAALRDDDPRIRMQAATYLGKLRSVESIDVLAAALTGRRWWVRSNTASALASLGEPGVHALRVVRGGDERFAAERAREQLMYLWADQ
jgi:HEAT repeat protein